MAALEVEREQRKRRERRDSGCAHERKQRAHSEERPPVHSHPPLHDHNRLEVERRAERLARARRPQYGKRRRAAPRPRHDEPPAPDAVEPPPAPAPAPPPAPALALPPNAVRDVSTRNTHREDNIDLGALHRQLGRDEPVPSLAAERAHPPEPEPAPAPATAHAPRPCDDRALPPPPDHRLEKIKKKISSLKRNISKYESDFETEHGHPMGRSDRMTDVRLTRMYEALQRLQAEKRCIKADPAEYALRMQAVKLQKERDERLDAQLKSDKPMAEVVRDIEEWLEACRVSGGRSQVAEGAWSAAQLAAEKACVQRALLRLEAARGRPPAHSAERGAARPLYDRYRVVKRALAHISMGGVNGELATIHEHEPMLFNSSVDSSSDSQERPSDTSQETADTPIQSPAGAAEEGPSSTSSARSTTASEEREPAPPEGLHCLGLEQLAKLLLEAKTQKSILRRSIKDEIFEVESRKMTNEENPKREEERARYRALKSRIKLLTALINKQKAT